MKCYYMREENYGKTSRKWLIVLIILIIIIGTLAFFYFDLQLKYKALDMRYTDLSHLHLILEANYTKLFNEYESLQFSHQLLQEEYNSLQSNYTSLEENYSSLRLKHKLLTDDYILLKNNYTILVLDYDTLKMNYDSLKNFYDILEENYNSLKMEFDILKLRWDKIFENAPANHTATTFIYYTNFGESFNIMNIHIPYDVYKHYHENMPHPVIYKGKEEEIRVYVTPDEPIIKNIVSIIKNQCKSEEELANALLDFVQEKSYALSNRYYYTNEYKYPIETLVEMGGDCDTHAILYATLLKAAGFKVLILLNGNHMAVAVHLTNPPTHNTQESYWFITYQGEKYYFAETTGWGWRVGDCPSGFKEIKFILISI